MKIKTGKLLSGIALTLTLALLLSAATSGMLVAAEGDETPGETATQVVYAGKGLTAVDGTEGKLEISKQAALVEDDDGNIIENMFDITLTVKTKENIREIFEEPNVAAILVLDYSSSLGSAASNVQTAARAFINEFKNVTSDETIRRIAVVKFAIDATTTGWKDADKTIDSDTAILTSSRGGTNYEAALELARYLFRNYGEGYSDVEKYVIFMTDGGPNHRISGNHSVGQYNGSPTNDNGGKKISGARAGSIPGSGGPTQSGQNYGRGAAQRITGSGNNQLNIPIHTIWYSGISTTLTSDEKTKAKEYLEKEISNIDSETNAVGILYDHDNIGGELSALFKNIAITITDPAPYVWKVDDPMGGNIDFQGFIVAGGNGEIFSQYDDDIKNDKDEIKLKYTPPSSPSSGSPTSPKGEITWYLLHDDPDVDEGDGSSKTTTFTAKYRIKIDNTISSFKFGSIDRPLSEINGEEDFLYDTNGSTILTYTFDGDDKWNDPNTDLPKALFDVPRVQAYAAPDFYFTKTGSDTDGEYLTGAIFELWRNENGKIYTYGPDQSEDLTSTGKVYFRDIPSGYTYTLEEKGSPTGYIAAASRNITVSFGQLYFTDSSRRTISDVEGIARALGEAFVNKPGEGTGGGGGDDGTGGGGDDGTGGGGGDDGTGGDNGGGDDGIVGGGDGEGDGEGGEGNNQEPPAQLPPALGELVPQDDGSFIELDADGVPLGRWTQDPDTGEWIFDEFPPLGAFDSPQTSDGKESAVWGALLVVSAAALVTLAKRRKSKSDS
ncbi:MAG: VWA domain-containing protein [Peptococcaceae bacterium]|jgi:hypothetical protein|nr:VWA domain-containing protein [Peptococcaceae bacterium]